MQTRDGLATKEMQECLLLSLLFLLYFVAEINCFGGIVSRGAAEPRSRPSSGRAVSMRPPQRFGGQDEERGSVASNHVNPVNYVSEKPLRCFCFGHIIYRINRIGGMSAAEDAENTENAGGGYSRGWTCPS